MDELEQRRSMATVYEGSRRACGDADSLFRSANCTNAAVQTASFQLRNLTAGCQQRSTLADSRWLFIVDVSAAAVILGGHPTSPSLLLQVELQL